MRDNNGRLISVIIPVYNGAPFIKETLESVKAQIYPTLECIIVDDGSSDNTAAVVKEWITRDDRFVYVYQPNRGLSAARNAGLDRARGAFIQFLDADDVLLPAKLEQQMNDLPKEGPVVSYTDYKTGTSSDIYTPSDYYRSARFDSTDKLTELITRWESSLLIPPHCFLISASFFREDKVRFDASLPNHEDFDCWVTLFRLQPSVKYIDQKLCIYRITDNSMSKKMRLMGEGFLQVLDKQLQTDGQTAAIRKVLVKKKRETLARYNRIDRMSLMDKIILFRPVLDYYKRRLFTQPPRKPD